MSQVADEDDFDEVATSMTAPATGPNVDPEPDTKLLIDGLVDRAEREQRDRESPRIPAFAGMPSQPRPNVSLREGPRQPESTPAIDDAAAIPVAIETDDSLALDEFGVPTGTDKPPWIQRAGAQIERGWAGLKAMSAARLRRPTPVPEDLAADSASPASGDELRFEELSVSDVAELVDDTATPPPPPHTDPFAASRTSESEEATQGDSLATSRASDASEPLDAGDEGGQLPKPQFAAAPNPVGAGSSSTPVESLTYDDFEADSIDEPTTAEWPSTRAAYAGDEDEDEDESSDTSEEVTVRQATPREDGDVDEHGPSASANAPDPVPGEFTDSENLDGWSPPRPGLAAMAALKLAPLRAAGARTSVALRRSLDDWKHTRSRGEPPNTRTRWIAGASIAAAIGFVVLLASLGGDDPSEEARLATRKSNDDAGSKAAYDHETNRQSGIATASLAGRATPSRDNPSSDTPTDDTPLDARDPDAPNDELPVDTQGLEAGEVASDELPGDNPELDSDSSDEVGPPAPDSETDAADASGGSVKAKHRKRRRKGRRKRKRGTKANGDATTTDDEFDDVDTGAKPAAHETLLAEAKQAHGREAYDLAKASLDLYYTDAARELMVLSACEMKNQALAKESFKKLPVTRRRRPIRKSCRKHGIRLGLGWGI